MTTSTHSIFPAFSRYFLMAMTMKCTVFGVVFLCSLEEVWHFRGTYDIQIHGQQETRNEPTRSRDPLLARFFLCLEDGRDTFLQNVGLSLKHTALQLKRKYASTRKYISLL
jgi:hypothetical protein